MLLTDAYAGAIRYDDHFIGISDKLGAWFVTFGFFCFFFDDTCAGGHKFIVCNCQVRRYFWFHIKKVNLVFCACRKIRSAFCGIISYSFYVVSDHGSGIEFWK